MLLKSHFFRATGIVMLCIPFALSGCSKKTEQDDNVIIVEKEQEESDFDLAVVTLGDIVITKKIKCTYTQLNEQDVCFSVSGRRISRIYVEDGDRVTKGQLLAELVNDNLDLKIERLEYQIARNQLLYDQLIAMENEALAKIDIKYPINDTMADYEIIHNQEEREKEYKEIYKSNEYAKEDYQDAIALDNMELEELKKEQAQSYIYATMDGVVTSIEKDLEGSTSVANKTIFRIIDDSECIFVVEDTSTKDLFNDGASVHMNIGFGKAAGDYVLTPYKFYSWDESLLFSIEEQPDGAVLEVGEIGSIEIATDKKENILVLPASAIHTAEGKEYVYVLNEDNLREVKWIETGLHGDKTVEITANLSEGDKVFLK